MSNHLSRRALVAALGAAIPAAAVAAGPALAGTDPIYAAIEAHRAALNASEEASAARDAVEEPMIVARDKGEMTWDQFHDRMEDPTLMPLVDRSSAALEAEETAFNALLATAPTTEAGRLALGRYGCELAQEEDGTPCTGANPAYRVLAALVGISTADPPMTDEDEA
jgi:hypothetical protein